MRSLFLALVACGSSPESTPAVRENKLETAIARDLAAKLGAAPAVRCALLWSIPIRCTATLPDHSTVAIAIRDTGTQYAWRVIGTIFPVAPLEKFVEDELADLGAAQNVFCGARIQHVDRLVCELERGGKAFVAIAADGTPSVELALDPAAAKARSDGPADLEHRSKALAHTEDDDDEVDSPP